MKKGIWGITQQLRKVTGLVRVMGETGQQSYRHKSMNKKSFFAPDIRDRSADSGQ